MDKVEKPGLLAGVQNYGDEVVKEMRKVSWPTREQLVANTALTLIATLIISVIIFGYDQVVSGLLNFIYR
jgi:preprotein translocase subunit SecE